jgi:pSer/pThr/pTyr-binding forkhead associated (FHA) protein
MAELVLETGELQGLRWILRPGAHVLGRSDDADLRLSLPMVARKQLRLTFGPDGGRVLSLSASNPTFLNGRLLEGEASLRDGDLLGIGQLRLRYLAGAGEAVYTAIRGSLIIRQAGRPERIAALMKPVLVIGREPSCDICLDFPAVSRRHVQIEWSGDGWQASDLGSHHGVEVDGRKISRPTPLKAGSALWLGDALGNGVSLTMQGEASMEAT